MRYCCAIFFFLIFLPGCFLATRDELYTVQRQTAQLEKEFKESVMSITHEAGQLKTTTAKLDELHDKLRKSFADTNVRIDDLEHLLGKFKGMKEETAKEIGHINKEVHDIIKTQQDSNKNLNAEIKKLNEELRFVKQQLAVFSNLTGSVRALRIQAQKPQQPAEPEKKKKEDVYEKALALYKKGEYEKAIDAFENFLSLFPQEALAGNALFWKGESYFVQKKYKNALEQFHRVITDFPNNNKVPAALYKEALCLDELGMRKESKAALEELVIRYPYSDEAKYAKKKLKTKK